MVSALTMLRLHESDTAAARYADLAEVLNNHGASGFVALDKVELFKRMVFNVLVSNDDDHLRNHAFVWDGARNGWRLSDLYDVVPKPQVATQRYLVLGVGQKGRLATLENALSAAGQFGILAGDAVAYINEIASVVREWRTWFDEYGVPQSECDKVASAFRNPKDIGLAHIK
jgi:serine/threonine-protein kinase HipA